MHIHVAEMVVVMDDGARGDGAGVQARCSKRRSLGTFVRLDTIRGVCLAPTRRYSQGGGGGDCGGGDVHDGDGTGCGVEGVQWSSAL